MKKDLRKKQCKTESHVVIPTRRTSNKTAFTLAEVLITLGIIGVVAALTMPVLIQNYRNQVVETRLKHFYSAINQAIVMSEAVNGDRTSWYENTGGYDENGTPKKLIWMQKYILPYMNILKYDKNANKIGVLGNSSLPVYYLPGGGAFASTNGGVNHNGEWVFWTGDPKKCTLQGNYENMGICVFQFSYNPLTDKQVSFEPERPDLRTLGRQNLEKIKENCTNNSRSGCTALIQLNNWKIPKDYPFKVRY